jgi:uncharacterized protein
MYQHDLTEAILDAKLNLTSVDAVAEVGVDVNTGSAAILEKVPALTTRLCNKIIQARPLRSRNELLKISGLGQKTFVNCAGFVRVTGGHEPLDNTMVHPESYGLARWLLKQLKWSLSDTAPVDIHTQQEEWKVIAGKASEKFGVPTNRAMTVINHLFTSITNPDPRLVKTKDSYAAIPISESISGCSPLPSESSTIESLRKSALPLRNILATVRNIVDFGVFVDIGLENDGLLHRSKMGNLSLDSLLVGQEIGVDILGVGESGKISVGLAGLDLPADTKRSNPDTRKPAAKRQRKK